MPAEHWTSLQSTVLRAALPDLAYDGLRAAIDAYTGAAKVFADQSENDHLRA
jgi:hypothetical protein